MKYRLIHLLLFISILIAASSCRDEESRAILPEEEKGAVNFTLNIPGLNIPSTYSMADTKENEIKDVDILVFNVDPSGDQTYAYHRQPTSVYNTNDGKAKFHTSLVEANNCNILIVANARDEVSNIIAGLTPNTSTKTDVLRLLEYSKTSKWEADDNGTYTNIPMIAETGKVNIAIGMKIEGISFIRMLARIDVKIDPAVPNTKFVLENIYLCNYSTNGRIATMWDSKGVLSTVVATNPNLPDGLTRKLGEADALQYIASGRTDYSGEIYTFETKAADKSNGFDHSDRKDATCLVVEGKYDGSATTTFYRIDFARNTGAYMPLLRNHQYQINIKQINGKGKSSLAEAMVADNQSNNMAINIFTYDEGEAKDIVFNGRYMLGVSKSAFRYYSGLSYDGTEEGAKLIVHTNFAEGWTVKISDINNKINPDWLGVTSYSGGNSTTYLALKVNATAADKAQEGYLDFTAGDLLKRVFFYSEDPFLEFTDFHSNGDIIDLGPIKGTDVNSNYKIKLKTNSIWKYTGSGNIEDMILIRNVANSPEIGAEVVEGQAAGNPQETNINIAINTNNDPIAGTKFSTMLTFSTATGGNNDVSKKLTLKRTVPVSHGMFKMIPNENQELPSGLNSTSTFITVTATSNTEWECTVNFDDGDGTGSNALADGNIRHIVPAAPLDARSVELQIQTNLGAARKIVVKTKYKNDAGTSVVNKEATITQKAGS